MFYFSNERQYTIIYNLLEAEQPITIREIAEICKVSARTIRTDLSVINDELTKAKVVLIKKPGVGIWLEGKLGQLMELKDYLCNQTVTYEPLTVEERRMQILNKLLITTKYTIARLSNELYVSKSTVYNDLNEVERWLNKYDLRLIRKQKYGIEVIGQEQSIREAMVHLLFERLKDYESEEIINMLKSNSDVYVSDYPILCDFCEKINLKFIKELLDYIEKDRKILFSREATLFLSLYTAISVKRIKANKVVKEIERELNIIKGDSVYNLAKVIAKRVSDEYDIVLTDEEIQMNIFQVFSSKLFKDYRLENDIESYDEINKKMLLLVVDLIFLWESQLNICLCDKNLVMDLTLYFKHLFVSYESGIKKEYFSNKFRDNFVLTELQKRDSYVFKIIQDATQMIKDRLGIILNKRDINYIALLLLSEIEHKKLIKNRQKCLIIANKENPLGKLMINRIKQHFSDLEFVEVINYHEVKVNKQLIFSVDIVISDKVIIDYPNIVVVSQLVTSNDIKLVKDSLNRVICEQ